MARIEHVIDFGQYDPPRPHCPIVTSNQTSGDGDRAAAEKEIGVSGSASVINSYRKRPVVIQATCWDGGPDVSLELWMGKYFESWIPSKQQLIISTLEGEMTASKGDWIIRGVNGEFYPIKDPIFRKTYDPVDAPTYDE